MASDEEIVNPNEDDSPPIAEIPYHRHPLHNAVVLANLFGMVPRDELSTYRKVCKSWYNGCLDIWRGSFTLSVNYYNVVHLYREDERDTPFHELLELVDNPQNNYSRTPYRKLCLNSFTFKLTAAGLFDPVIIHQFFSTPLVGDNIAKLTLYDCEFRGMEEFRSIIFRFCPNLESLSLVKNRYPPQGPLLEPFEYVQPVFGERLKLKSISIEMSITCGFVPVSWFEIFSHFPSVESFKLNGNLTFGCNESKINNLLRAIQLIRGHDVRKLPLKEFDIEPFVLLTSSPLSRHTFELLQELKLAIRRLHITMDNFVDQDLFKNIIRLHARSLVSIVQEGSCLSTGNFPFGAYMRNLESLELTTEGICGDMEFLQYTPNLAKLEVTRGLPGVVSRGLQPEELATDLICNTLNFDLTIVTLKELNFDVGISAEATRRLVQLFPNVQSLTMVLNDEKFRIICEHWRGLTRLVAFGTFLTDNGVIGEIHKGKAGSTKHSTTPTILNLKSISSKICYCLETDLTYFSSMSQGVTDASVFHGFLKLPKLVELEIPHRLTMTDGNYWSWYPTISDNAKRALLHHGIRFVE